MAANQTKTAALDFTTFHNVIDGQLTGPGTTYHTVNPANLENNLGVPSSTLGDVNSAVEAAQRAAKSWAEVPWDDRKTAPGGFIAALEDLSDDFAQMLNKEQGKPVSIAAQRLNSGPAVLTGNAFILKPSPFTPYCGLKMAELGTGFFPPGIFQALSGEDELGHMLSTHPGVEMVTLTGSVETGKKVMAACNATLKRVILELGGNDAAIVCTPKNSDVRSTAVWVQNGVLKA
ncbi:Uu.00g105310.m01.CDS01 [Anthostomella pinea]|uniref:aldehyde dehydrogenase (NAD(+)) n=1 Tax=Anthostomella pinea TaxID=933095 RepID=A0AAI8VDV3_9PEZI|nr:Uu.00g105310.m01.CDS01 [Anthostomella pinea]